VLDPLLLIPEPLMSQDEIVVHALVAAGPLPYHSGEPYIAVATTRRRKSGSESSG
jgi:hypothetical protein